MSQIGRRHFIKGAAALTCATALQAIGAPSSADAWPSKPVRVIVPLAAGGGLDYVARQCAQVVSSNLGQQFYVENHTGAGGPWAWISR